MTKNERIAELEREVAELKKRPQVTYVFPPYQPVYPSWPTYYRPYWQTGIYCGTTTTVSTHNTDDTSYRSLDRLWGSENPDHPNHIPSQFIGVGGGL